MEDNHLFFASIHDTDFESFSAGKVPASVEHDLEDDETEEARPELFYLACRKALIRLKRYAASSPSF